MHLSDISWNETGEEAVRNYKKGDEIETVILSIDPERERISLGIKQLEEDSFTIYLGESDKGSIVNGEVTEVDAKGAVIKLNEEVDGYIKVADLSRERIEDARSVSLNVCILNYLREAHKLRSKMRRKRLWGTGDYLCTQARKPLFNIGKHSNFYNI